MKGLIKLYIVLIILFSSCKHSVDQSRKNACSQEEKMPIEVVHKTNNFDKINCIVYKDSVKIRQIVLRIKDDLKHLSERDFLKKYDLKNPVHQRDSITIINSEPELYFEAKEGGCLICVLYFNYNFIKTQDPESWKGEHQTMVEIEKENGVFKVKSIIHF